MAVLHVTGTPGSTAYDIQITGLEFEYNQAHYEFVGVTEIAFVDGTTVADFQSLHWGDYDVDYPPPTGTNHYTPVFAGAEYANQATTLYGFGVTSPLGIPTMYRVGSPFVKPAVWPYPHEVVYDGNATGVEDLPVDTAEYFEDETVTVKFVPIASRVGYTLLGWDISSSATSPTYADGGTETFIMPDDDVTLYAVWRVLEDTTATLTLTSTSKSITAQVTGLDPLHGYTRLFKWYIDGVLARTVPVAPPISSQSNIYSPVYFASSHSIKVEIYNSTGSVLYFTDTKSVSTLYPTITPWSWSVTNGEATTFQTMAAKSALDNKELVSHFSYKVWRDFVNKVAEARTETGQAWLPTYATKENTLVDAQYDSYMAAMHNATVENIQYPLWSWHQQPSTEGYLGRLQVRGFSTMGANADTVYATYLLELARKLNLVIGIYNNTGQLVPLGTALNTALIIAANLEYSPPEALQVDHMLSLIAEAQLLQQLPQALSSNQHTQLSSEVVLISRPFTPLSAEINALLTQSAQVRYKPPGAMSAVPLNISLAISAALIYKHITYLLTLLTFSLSIEALLEFNGQKSVLQTSLESTLSSLVEVGYDPPLGLSAVVQAALTASFLVRTAEGYSIQTDLQSTLTVAALLEMEAVIIWEYPIQTDTDLYIRQVYSCTQAGNSLSLE